MRKKLQLFIRSKAETFGSAGQTRQHQVGLSVVLALVGCAVFAAGFAMFPSHNRSGVMAGSRVVHLYVDGKKQTMPTHADTVGEMLKRLAVPIGQYDVVEPAADAPISADDFNINVYRAQPVTVVDEGNKATVGFSAQKAPKEIAKQAGVTVYPEDHVKLELPEDIAKEGIIGAKVVIDRATPTNLNLYGTPVTVRTHARTVKELLAEKNVHLAEGDSVQPQADTPLTSDVQVYVTRSGTQIASVEEPLPVPVQVVEDPSLSFGTHAIRQKGAPGKKLVTYEIQLLNSKEVGRRKIQETKVLDPVTEIVARGPVGSFGEALTKLRGCEAGGNYANKKNSVYRGAYQFNYSTWANYGGYYDPADAPPVIQDQKAMETYQRRGWQPWPACSNKLGLQDIYR